MRPPGLSEREEVRHELDPFAPHELVERRQCRRDLDATDPCAIPYRQKRRKTARIRGKFEAGTLLMSGRVDVGLPTRCGPASRRRAEDRAGSIVGAPHA